MSKQGGGADMWSIEGDGLERLCLAFERIAAALELLAKPVKEDIERRAETAEREEQARDYYESRRMGGP